MPVRFRAEKPVDMPKFMMRAMGSFGMTLCPTLPFGPIARASSFHAAVSATDQVICPEAPGS